MCREGAVVLVMTARNSSSVSVGVLPRCSASRRWLWTSGRKRAASMLRSHCHWLRLAAAVRWATTCSTSHSPHRVSCRHCCAPRPARSSASAARSACASAHRWSSCGRAISLDPSHRCHRCKVDRPRPLESSPCRGCRTRSRKVQAVRPRAGHRVQLLSAAATANSVGRTRPRQPTPPALRLSATLTASFPARSGTCREDGSRVEPVPQALHNQWCSMERSKHDN